MPTTTNEETVLLKTDVLGRVRMPSQRREAILDAFEESGMSGQSFARHIGVKYPTFASWVQKRRHERGEYPRKKLSVSPPSEIKFLEAQIEKRPERCSGSALEVETSDGIKLIIRSDEEVGLAAELIRCLAKG